MSVQRADPEQCAVDPTGKRGPREARLPSGAAGYASAGLIVALATALAWGMFPHLALSNLIMVYLLGVLLVATRFGRGPSVVASVLSVAAFDYFFVPPRFTLVVTDTQSVLTFAVMLIVALVISDLTNRIRAQAEAAHEREWRTAALYAMTRDLGHARAVAELIAISVRHVADVFASEVVVVLPGAGGTLSAQAAPGSSFEPDATELAAARWALQHRQPAGLGTAAQPAARALYVPLLAPGGALGVLGVRPRRADAFGAVERLRQLESFASQTALALERARLSEEAQEARLRMEAERLRSSLLSSVSHDLRTPLATITGAASALIDQDGHLDATTRRELLESVRDEAERLNRLVQNLLDMMRLESGALELQRDWYPMEEVVGAALRRARKALAGRRVDVAIAPELPLVLMDDVLVEQLLINLLDNAAKYTPAGSPIRVAATASEGRVSVEVADQGPGLPPGSEERVFDKFFRAGGTPARGAGLGLAICKAIVQAHGGRVWAHNLPEGGVAFFFTLLLAEAPPAVVETER